MNDHHRSVGDECFAERIYIRMSNTLLDIVRENQKATISTVCVVEGISALGGAVASKIEDMPERNESVVGAICSILGKSECDVGAVLAQVRELMEDELQPAGHA